MSFSDDELLRLLHQAMGDQDRPPERLRDMALRAQLWDTEAARLAATTYDSLVDTTPIRGTGAPRDLTFSHDDVAIELTVEATSGRRTRLTGTVVGDDVSGVVVTAPETEPIPVSLDKRGRFDLEVDMPAAVVQVNLAGRGDRVVRTELIVLTAR
jgi:hypothetical protein